MRLLVAVPEISGFDHRSALDHFDLLQAGDGLQIDHQRDGAARNRLYPSAEHDGRKDQRPMRHVGVPRLERLREARRVERAVRMSEGSDAPGFLVPHIVRIGAGAQIIVAPLVPIVPEAMDHFRVVLGHRGIDLDEVECRVESTGRDAARNAGEVAIGNERMIHLNHEGAQATSFPEQLIDRGGPGIDRQLLAQGQRIRVEMAPRCRQLDGRNEGNPTAGGNRLQSPVIDGRIVIADEQQIQSGRKLRARQIRGRRDRLRLVGVMMQVRPIPAAGGWIEKRRQQDFFLLVGARADSHRHLPAGSEKRPAMRYLEAVIPRRDRDLRAALSIEVGKEFLSAEKLDQRALPLKDGDARIQGNGAARINDRELDPAGRGDSAKIQCRRPARGDHDRNRRGLRVVFGRGIETVLACR
jgi:hypothetical protein